MEKPISISDARAKREAKRTEFERQMHAANLASAFATQVVQNLRRLGVPDLFAARALLLHGGALMGVGSCASSYRC
jgi:hypothetical protein